MTTFRPIRILDTHEVMDQPPPLEAFDRFTSEGALVDAVTVTGGQPHLERLGSFGRRTGSLEVIQWGGEANRNPPVLETHDRFGNRIDEVQFHPAYHQLMALGLDERVAVSVVR